MKNMEVKIIPLFISLVLLVLFVCPVPMGILNIGNVFGIIVSGTMSLIFLFWKPFKHFIKNLWSMSGGKVFISIMCVLLALFVVYAIVISIFMIKSANDPPPDENTTVVVLGCKVKNGRPSLMLKRRLNASYRYLSEHPDVNVVVSGGQGSDEIMSEAQCMKDYLISKGIEANRIFMEDKSTNTEENLKFSQQIINNNELPETITLVTDAFHQYRSEILAKNMGINPYNISGYTSWYITPTYWVREWFGIAYYSLLGNK